MLESSHEDAALAFPQRLMAAIRRCVEGRQTGGVTRGHAVPAPEGLVNVVMLLLTQIGLALASVACAGPRLALCGGVREICYELSRVGWDEWEIQSKFCAHGFKLFQEAGSSDAACPCNPVSSMTRGFCVRLALSEEDAVGCVVEVQDVYEHLDIIDPRGCPVSFGPSSLRPTPPRQGGSPRRGAALQGCHQACQPGLLVQCSAGRCAAPRCLGGGGGRASLWSRLSGSCAAAPDLQEAPSSFEVLVY